MRTELRGLILCSLVFLTGMRDPFRPPVDRCEIGKLNKWHYQGLIRSAGVVGIIKDEQDRWHRAHQEDHLPSGWRVLAINETEMVIEVGDGCDPKEWRWKREGTKNEKNKDSRSVGAVQHVGMEPRSKASDPGG
ncbi:DUF2531 family protein [Lelliottia amnigena]|uniref:HofP DNA utilization family protein n=1 Tax=Lelliottia amnigena TaxID=61646 RepID=UPI00157552AF|nr:HofP DNA utilization family protein [Lelliottia amnigena]NTX71259.1 DUF2531 family protein [Lelliottia amnigena]